MSDDGDWEERQARDSPKRKLAFAAVGACD